MVLGVVAKETRSLPIAAAITADKKNKERMSAAGSKRSGTLPRGAMVAEYWRKRTPGDYWKNL